MGASQAIIVAVTDKVAMKRYAPGSIPKYAEAKPSKFEQVQVGDQLAARGDKSADGTTISGLGDYSVLAVSVANAGGDFSIAAAEALRITVTAQHVPTGTTVSLQGYRFR